MSTDITIAGLASRKIVKTIPLPLNPPKDLSLMDFLIANNITIASSCGGVGSCNKCLINEDIQSCQVALIDFIKVIPSLRIEISYL